MTNRTEHIAYLWRQYIAGKASKADVEELFSYRASWGSDEEQAAMIEQILAEHPAEEEPSAEARERALQEIFAGGDETKVRRMPAARWWWAAASIIGVLSLGTYLWMTNHRPAQTITSAPVTTTYNKGIILTLADGSQVTLNQKNDTAFQQQGARAVLNNGQLAYNGTAGNDGVETFNTIRTTRGKQFQLQLSDGTLVWLNAASSIRFPTSFTGQERKVTVTGEAYFEVAKNSRMPFIVNVDDKAEIDVLGTNFNINAYADESSINTTLLEGSVRTFIGRKSQQGTAVTLKPGQQARITNAIQVVNDPDIDKIMAWKNGLFNFQGLPLGEVLRQLERWYDIKVKYNSSASNLIFGGEMYRNVNLSDVLDMFRDMGIKYEWDGKTLTVL